jgi:hypothetical protein
MLNLSLLLFNLLFSWYKKVFNGIKFKKFDFFCKFLKHNKIFKISSFGLE